MAEDDNKQGDLKFYQNQPYDMEVDLNNEDDGDENDLANQAQVPKKSKKRNSE